MKGCWKTNVSVLINSYSEIASIDEKKKSAELQNRSYEVEVRTRVIRNPLMLIGDPFFRCAKWRTSCGIETRKRCF